MDECMNPLTEVLDVRSLLRGSLPTIAAEERDGKIWLTGMNDETRAVIPGISAVPMPLNLNEAAEYPDGELFLRKFKECQTSKRSIVFYHTVKNQKWLCVITPIYIEGKITQFVLYTIEISPKGQCMVKSTMDSFVTARMEENLKYVESLI